mmetsp:Transcript_18013/g.32626  ORF Transcript_18013/g.32626 Transcript_18013/m.32626 type:complete len:97 (+) Transcript_18013:455-745(+)
MLAQNGIRSSLQWRLRCQRGFATGGDGTYCAPAQQWRHTVLSGERQVRAFVWENGLSMRLVIPRTLTDSQNLSAAADYRPFMTASSSPAPMVVSLA